MREIADLVRLEQLAGQELGVGEWLTIEQERIDQFADVTEDRQWIHVDLDRAAAGPYGGTIAHGYLTLSLLPLLASSAFTVGGVESKLNYGLERVRFPAIVRSGARVRDRASLVSAERVDSGVRAVVRNVVEVEGSDRPACVADTVSLYVERKGR